jgi:Ca-activated chloride channel family protein
MERSKLLEGGATTTYRELYHPYLSWAVLFLVLEVLLRATILRVFP